MLNSDSSLSYITPDYFFYSGDAFW